MSFNPTKDNIAITVPSFTFKKGAGSILFENITDLVFSEPYLVTVAIDSNDVEQKVIDFNFAEFPNIRRGGVVNMIGNGHLVYGPKNPGEFVAVSVLLMESNRGARASGEEMSEIIKNQAIEIKVIEEIGKLISNSQSSAALKLMQSLLGQVSSRLQKSKDKFLMRTEGIFFKNTSVPYDINRQFIRGNEFADLTIQVIPLMESNGQGPKTKVIDLNKVQK